jgi:ADP-heptose:LPS heptosyltransferase
VNEPRRIVLARTDRVGDLILSTPAIASVRASFPHAHITLVSSRYNSIVVDRSPDIDELVTLPTEISPALFGARFRGACDLAIALAPRTVDIALVGGTGAARRIGYTYVRRKLARLAARFRLTDVLVSEADPVLAERPNVVVRHEVDQVLALVERAGATNIVRELRLPLRDVDRALVQDVAANAIVVHLAPRWVGEGSSLASVLDLCRELRRFGRPIVATYGDDAIDLAHAVRNANVADQVIGTLPFFAWAAIFERAACIVTVDTGATHVASAMRRPTVVLFEHRYFRLNSQEWSPYRVPSALVRKPANADPAALAACRAEIVAAVGGLLC